MEESISTRIHMVYKDLTSVEKPIIHRRRGTHLVLHEHLLSHSNIELARTKEAQEFILIGPFKILWGYDAKCKMNVSRGRNWKDNSSE